MFFACLNNHSLHYKTAPSIVALNRIRRRAIVRFLAHRRHTNLPSLTKTLSPDVTVHLQKSPKDFDEPEVRQHLDRPTNPKAINRPGFLARVSCALKPFLNSPGRTKHSVYRAIKFNFSPLLFNANMGGVCHSRNKEHKYCVDPTKTTVSPRVRRAIATLRKFLPRGILSARHIKYRFDK